jgi:molybdopterin molybdotransferase
MSADPFPALLPLADALAILRTQPECLGSETILSGDAAGRICAQTVVCPSPIPPHTGAGFDGFAVRARDVAQASPQSPILLPVAGKTRCGDPPLCGLPNTAWEVFAGAALPSPFDAVVRYADAGVVALQDACLDDGAPTWIRLTAPVAAGTDVRLRGEDIAEGEVIAASGRVLRPPHLMALATAGIERVVVRTQPRVAVVSTGRELVDDVRDALEPGQVRNSNAPYLVTMLQRHGALPRYLRTVNDDRDELQRSLAWASTHRFPLTISSGSTTAGREDFVGDVLLGLGAELLFRGVAIQPGWPVLLARLPHGGLFLGLPGNPASCAACFRLFALPLLRVLSGLPPEMPSTALLAVDVPRDPQKTRLLKARVQVCAGRRQARPLPGQEAHRIAPLLEANAWILLPPGHAPAHAGDVVETLPIQDDWSRTA